jgi:glucosamine--fructose-6-phosphate aminotransferase (isomerizing)
MCGVISIVYPGHNPALGREAGNLVKQLEYRGYDSTGVATIGTDGTITLKKSVGAPSRVVEALRIGDLAGQKAIGQVRWATYGSVTDTNAQPHEVRCHAHVVGAHNGNISNTDALKEFLRERKHHVVSDNDGEMLVHVVEHFFAEEGGLDPALDAERRREAALRAIRRADAAVVGSYAACIALPGIPGVFAMKAGSSLYAGKGADAGGEYVVVSSDLTSVLSKTRALIPLAEGEGLYFTHADYVVFSLREPRESRPPLRRSRLNVADIALQPPYRFFMEQEIAHAGTNLDAILANYFRGPGERERLAALEPHAEDVHALVAGLLALADVFEPAAAAERRRALLSDPRLARLGALLPAAGQAAFASDEAPLLEELLATGGARDALLALDRLVSWQKKTSVLARKDALLADLRRARQVYLLGSGTSYHACLAGAAFLASLGGLAAHAVNPGHFRTTYLPVLQPDDVVLAVTQSGETKDLVDVLNDVRARHGRTVRLLALVNNENSTIPQEKADAFLPLLCGPEIAVAATKSFVSQLAVFYVLARSLREDEAAVAGGLARVRGLLGPTLDATAPALDEIARRFHLKPSLHILGTSLAGIAKEGALKVREVVLNHTEGYDAAEFKHGPNTILGKNTVLSWTDAEGMLERTAGFAADLIAREGPGAAAGLLARLAAGGFAALHELSEREPGAALAKERLDPEKLFGNYPLLFVCGPDPRDVRITVSQIHTHKIRGADVVLVAPENPDLRRAVEGRPDRAGDYFARYVVVPPCADPHAFVFQAAVVLQVLALRMSIAKMEALDAAGVCDHGVHPDVPKNVSKSITVD